ncbi:MAG: hypothetical protein EHM89_13160, partial [Acidobacteria bacterium]
MALSSLVISDVHLDARPLTPNVERRDAALAEVIARSAQSAHQRRSRFEVVCAGDLFDYDVHPYEVIDAPSAQTATSEILARHPRVTSALVETLRRGDRVVVLPGNHDSALRLKRVRNHLQAIFRAASRPDANLLTPSWLYRSPTGVHIEHGDAYDPLCVTRLSNETLDPSVGSVCARYLPDMIPDGDPYAKDPFQLGVSPRTIIDRLRPQRALPFLQELLAVPTEGGLCPRAVREMVANERIPEPLLQRHAELRVPKATALDATQSLMGDVTYGQLLDDQAKRAMQG